MARSSILTQHLRRSFAFALAAAAGLVLARPAAADEGMWTFDNFPAAKVAKSYGFRPTSAFLQHLERSSLRIAGGCSASFVSPQGLVLTNHHCVVGCEDQLSTARDNLVENGFYAKRGEDERRCPDYELDQLVRIENVNAAIHAATAGKRGAAANAALRAAQARAQATCGKDPAVRCDVVSLYHGGIYELYHYKRYTDVRLAFAPEFSVAQFGGDPDNFNFPRYDFDVGLLRAYENGRPAGTPDYLHWSAAGSQPGELVFTSGDPGRTSRELTVAQLAYLRDYDLPVQRAQEAELRGVLEEYSRGGGEPEREAHESLFYLENGFKVTTGRRLALVDQEFFGRKVAEEKRLRALVDAKPALRALAGGAWDEIARLQAVRLELAPRDTVQRLGVFRYGLLADALTLVRAAAERTKPNGSRLPEFTDQALVGVAQEIEAPKPVYPGFEQRTLAFGLTKLRETLGADSPLVAKFLGRETPDQVAQRLVSGTKLGDAAVRKALFEGGSAAVAASTDPLIAYARSDRPRPARHPQGAGGPHRGTLARRGRAHRQGPLRGLRHQPRSRRDLHPAGQLRLGEGLRRRRRHDGRAVHHDRPGCSAAPSARRRYILPQSWLDAKAALDPSTPMNLSTTNDIIGGNSGSPLVNRRGEVVGLIFDGNIFSLGGDFGYDAARNRAVSVDSRALLTAFGTVYHADRLVNEITTAR